MSEIKEKVREFIEKVRAGRRSLRSAGRNLGHVLVGPAPVEAAKAFGEAVGCMPSDADGMPEEKDPAFIAGYMACMRDVSTAYQLSTEDKNAKDPELIATSLEKDQIMIDLLQFMRGREYTRHSEAIEALRTTRNVLYWKMDDLCKRNLAFAIPSTTEAPFVLTTLGEKVCEVLDKRLK